MTEDGSHNPHDREDQGLLGVPTGRNPHRCEDYGLSAREEQGNPHDCEDLPWVDARRPAVWRHRSWLRATDYWLRLLYRFSPLAGHDGLVQGVRQA